MTPKEQGLIDAGRAYKVAYSRADAAHKAWKAAENGNSDSKPDLRDIFFKRNCEASRAQERLLEAARTL